MDYREETISIEKRITVLEQQADKARGTSWETYLRERIAFQMEMLEDLKSEVTA